MIKFWSKDRVRELEREVAQLDKDWERMVKIADRGLEIASCHLETVIRLKEMLRKTIECYYCGHNNDCYCDLEEILQFYAE